MKFLLTFFLLLTTSAIYPHAFLTAPTPRTFDDNLKVPPCGNTTRSNSPHYFLTGDRVTVQWSETINHTGRFIINLIQEQPGQDLQVIQIKEVIDDQNDPIPDKSKPHLFSTEIKLPNIVCKENCSLQLIQSMEERTPTTYYYSCADIALVDTIEEFPKDSSSDSDEGGTVKKSSAPNIQSDNTGLGCSSSFSQTNSKSRFSYWYIAIFILPLLLFRKLK